MKLCLYLFLISFIQVNFAAIYRLSDEEYELMPPISHLDPFEKCLRHPGGRYCTAYATYVADDHSPLLTQMQEYSAHTASHFNHTRALYGTCLSLKCKQLYEDTITDPGVVLEACLNDTVWKEYNLKVKVEDISCYEHNEKKLNIDAADKAVAGILLALVVCNVVGSLFDIFRTSHDTGTVASFLLCFSIPHNWRRLTAPPEGPDPRLNSLKAIYGIRAISMAAVISLHALLPSLMFCKNPKALKEMYENVPMHILLNGTLIMQTFFFLSAFLLVYNLQLYTEKHKVTWRMLPVAILRRWLRMTPAYALVLAVTATWLRYAGSGPMWDRMVVSEAMNCRSNWWQNLLYINNYAGNMQCMPQTWYLAADTQLYYLGLVIFLCCQILGSRKLILPILFLIGMIIPALHTYYQDLDAALIMSPSTVINILSNNSTFNEVYKRAHTNLPCYIMGMYFGYLVYSLQKNNFDARKYTRWRPLYWLLFPFGTYITILCKAFYEEGPRLSLHHRALIAAFIKPVFGLAVALVIVGMIFKMDDLYRGILEWRGWTCPGRVSYSAFLLHMAFVRTTSGTYDYSLHISYLRIAEIALCTVVMTFIAAYVFWITVEAPLGQLVKTCLDTSPGSTAKKYKNNE